MARPDEPAASTRDRRKAERLAVRTKVRLIVDTKELEGHADNISSTGVLFFSDGLLRVTVELVEDGKTVRRPGRLVRAQRMRADSTGWAVEFDPQ